MKIILVPMGSTGDVHPFIAIGTVLRRRGHDVTVITSAVFKPLTQQAGLQFVPVGTAEEFDLLRQDSKPWNSWRGFETVIKGILRVTPSIYRSIQERYVPGNTIVAASGVAFGARIAQESLGVPLTTIHLQPAYFHSLYQSPILHASLSTINSLPRLAKHGLFRLSHAFADWFVGPETNRFRSQFGLPPARQFVNSWLHSPQRVIGLFPDWFGPPQPDWPPQTVLTGFPLYDKSEVQTVPHNVARFLDDGDPPIAFTPGSARLALGLLRHPAQMRHSQRFLKASVEACQLLGRRGVLLTPYQDQVPRRLPPGIQSFKYVPFSQLLPRCAAIVHHGGVGTLAQGFAAGLPQLVMPMTHDKPDNAVRLKRLGVGRMLKPSAFRGSTAAQELDMLLTSPGVADSCKTLAQKLLGCDAVERTCDLLEEMPGN